MGHFLSSNLKNALLIPPQAIGTGATVNGSSMDCQGAEFARVLVNMGAIGAGANISVVVKLQQSANDSDWADITSATTGAVLNANEKSPFIFDLNLSELKQYIRPVATGGSVGGGLCSVSIDLHRQRHDSPQTQVNTPIRIGG